MITANLYADLTSRGVALGISDDGLHLTFKAPKGALSDALKRAMQRHRDELLDYVFSLEERAALMSDGSDAPELRERALLLTPFGTATPDGLLYLRDLLAHDSTLESLNRIHTARFGCPFEIVSVERQAG